MMYPLISILVANYNSGCFIAETLDSICAQTYPNIEVVIVDDCSTDKSLQVISAYLSSHLMHSISVNHFSYPHSAYNMEIANELRLIGYKSAALGYGGSIRKGMEAMLLNRKYIVQK